MKKIFFLFRTDIRQLESYHSINNLEEFKKKCWDFYLLQCIYFLENNIYDEVVVWRLQPEEFKKDIIFNINGKKFIQKWINNIGEIFNYSNSHTSFFRGGFKIYCDLTKANPNFFGLKLYLGASKRTNPQYGGIYDKILVEDNSHITSSNHIPFYKTASKEIFKPLNLTKKYDLIWICNFSQIIQKGQEFFISNISKSSYLRSLRIVHIGNKSDVGKLLCQKYDVHNIEFFGHLNRDRINEYLNRSNFGIITSNEDDGCPRIITEILCSGTSLLIRNKTKLLNFYKEKAVVGFNDDNIEQKIKEALNSDYKNEALENVDRISIDKICNLNLNLWR